MPTPFLWQAGSSNNGLLVPVFNLMTTELNSLANNAVIVSSVGGTSGVFSNSNTGQGVFADIFWEVGNPGITTALSTGAGLSGWFLETPDGTNYESATVVPSRVPDFIIPLPATTIAAGAVYKSQGQVVLPALKFKVLIQNVTGQPLGSGVTTAPALVCASQALQY